jgi:ActR/RegA family two-component response regulator
MFCVRAVTALLLDDDLDLLEVMADVLAAYGWRSLTVCSVADLQALGRGALAADVAVLDINLGPSRPSGIDAYDWLVAQGFPGRILFLTGHARSHPLVARAQHLSHATVLEKPTNADILMNRIQGRA